MQSTSFTVDYRVKDGSATNEDYTFLPRRLTFGPGESEKEIQQNITDDQLDEDDEQIQIELVNADGPRVQIGKKAAHTFTILDPRPIIGFEKSLSGEFKRVSSIDIPLTLSAAVPQQVSVDYIVTAISEIQKRDVRLESGVISFAPGEMRKSISTKFTPKITQEANLTVNIALTNPVNAKLGTQKGRMCSPLSNNNTYGCKGHFTVGLIPARHGNWLLKLAPMQMSLFGWEMMMANWYFGGVRVIFHIGKPTMADGMLKKWLRVKVMGPDYNMIKFVSIPM